MKSVDGLELTYFNLTVKTKSTKTIAIEFYEN